MSIFKDSFPDFVKNELTKRQDNMFKHDFNTVATLTNRTAWIRMISGVVIDGDNYDLTKQWVLTGGDSQIPNQVFSGYTQGNKFGIRPIPGIMGIDVDSISANGSLRKITVNFIAWDVTQLEILEKLYMRPGYTVCIEWGWTHNVGDNKISSFNSRFGDEFLKLVTNQQSKFKGLSLLELYKQGYQYMAQNNGNYDVSVGKVSNYGWQVRPDGSYECTTTIITYGEILDSLKCNYTALSPINNFGVGLCPPRSNNGYESDEEPRPHYEKSLLSGLLYELKMYSQLQSQDGVYVFNTSNKFVGADPSNLSLTPLNQKTQTVADFTDPLNPVKTITYTPASKNIPVTDFAYRVFITNQIQNVKEYSEIDAPNSPKKAFIMLKDFCRLLNDYILPKNNNGRITEITVSPQKLSTVTPSSSEITDSTRMNAYPIQVPMDVNICVFYPKIWVEGIKIDNPTPPPSTISKPNTDITKYNVAKKFISDFKNRPNDYTIARYVYENRGNNIPAISIEYKLVSRNILNYIFSNITEYIANATTKIYPINRSSNGSIYYGQGNILTDPILVGGLANVDISNLYLVALEDNSFYVIDNNKKFYSFLKSTPINPVNLLPVKDRAGDQLYPIEQIVNVETLKDVLNSLQLNNVWFNYLFQQAVADRVQLNNQITTDILNNLFTPLKDYPFFTDETYSSAYIGNMFINLDYLIDLIGRAEISDPNRKNEVSFSYLFNTLLNTIQNSIGSINDLRVHIDPLDNIARIIDMDYVDNSINDLFEIQLHNTKSVVKDYKLESMIFPEQSTIIAVSAQTKSGRLGYGNQHLVAYNHGIEDKIIQKIDSPIEVDNNSGGKKEYLEGLLSSIASYYITITTKS